MSEIGADINKVVSHAAAELIERFFRKTANVTEESVARLKVRFGVGFSHYLETSLEKYSTYKTILSRYDDLEIGKHYVPMKVKLGGENYRFEDFFRIFLQKKKIVLEGTAGLGKTLFLRNLFRYCILNSTDYIPVLVELRHLHTNSDKTILEQIAQQLAAHVKGFTIEHLRFGLQEGKFIVFLDALDEISSEFKDRYDTEIREFADVFRVTPLLISSRPNTSYPWWTGFSVARLVPMERDQTLAMLSNLPFDELIAENFISRIDLKFFVAHKDFLSIPLLATLMMMTFADFADVPARIHIFYEQAFQTLFYKHDSLKGAFSRPIECKLDIVQFKRVLSAFCFISYSQECFSFSKSKIIEYMSLALEIEDISVDPELFLQDLTLTVCILQIDGVNVIFIHRSFQEYFTALFAINSRSLDLYKFVDRLMPRAHLDSVAITISQINPEALDEKWTIPKIQIWSSALAEVRNQDDVTLLTKAFGDLQFAEHLSFSATGPIDVDAFCFLMKLSNIETPNDWDISKFYGDEARIRAYLNRNIGLRDEIMYDSAVNLVHFPRELVLALDSVKAWASALKSIWKIQEGLERKAKSRSGSIKALLKIKE